MSENPVPYSPREHAHPSQSQSISQPSSSSNVSDIRTVHESDFDSDTYALAQAISDHWKVDDPEWVVIAHGARDVATVHVRMLGMARKQKLSNVGNLGGYFMTALINLHKPKPKGAGQIEDRSDDYYEGYLRRQKERGQ